MQRALDLAILGGKHTKSNPNVGCVIVHDNIIIGEGYHASYGGPHAEVQAIRSVVDQSLIGSSTVYVTLEPCCITNKTPPCTDLLIKHSPKRVVISVLDPNPLVAGNGVRLIEAAGIPVSLGVLEESGKELIASFKTNLAGMPYIILKIVQSNDGYIGCKDKQVWISNAISKHVSHKWRSEVDGILVGTATALTDNPALTNRLWPGVHPTRIVFDRNLVIAHDAPILNGDARTIVLNGKKDGIVGNITYIDICELTLKQILLRLYKEGIYRLLVEGGSDTINRFLNARLWDECIQIICPILLQNTPCNQLILAPYLVGSPSKQYHLGGDTLRIIKPLPRGNH